MLYPSLDHSTIRVRLMVHDPALHRAEEIREHHTDLARIAAVLTADGRPTTIEEAYDAWRAYSDRMCATWMVVPTDDDAEILYHGRPLMPDANHAIENSALTNLAH